MSSKFSRPQLADRMPAGTCPIAEPARAQAVGEIMTVDVNFIDSTPQLSPRDVDQGPAGASACSPVGNQNVTVHAPGPAAARGLSYDIGRYEVAVPVRQLEMELT